MAHTHELLPATGGGVCCWVIGCGFELTADETAALISDLLKACEALAPVATDEYFNFHMLVAAIKLAAHALDKVRDAGG